MRIRDLCKQTSVQAAVKVQIRSPDFRASAYAAAPGDIGCGERHRSVHITREGDVGRRDRHSAGVKIACDEIGCTDPQPA